MSILQKYSPTKGSALCVRTPREQVTNVLPRKMSIALHLISLSASLVLSVNDLRQQAIGEVSRRKFCTRHVQFLSNMWYVKVLHLRAAVSSERGKILLEFLHEESS